MKTKLLSLVLVAVMCLFAFSACGDDALEKITVNVKATADGSIFVDTVVIIEFEKGYTPTALEAIRQACTELELAYTLWNNDMSLQSISGEGVGPYDSSVEGANGETMWWRCTVNGIESEDLPIGEIAINNGDTVEIFFEKFVMSDK